MSPAVTFSLLQQHLVEVLKYYLIETSLPKHYMYEENMFSKVSFSYIFIMVGFNVLFFFLVSSLHGFNFLRFLQIYNLHRGVYTWTFTITKFCFFAFFCFSKKHIELQFKEMSVFSFVQEHFVVVFLCYVNSNQSVIQIC